MDLFYIIPAIFILGVCTRFPPGLEPPPPPFEGTPPPPPFVGSPSFCSKFKKLPSPLFLRPIQTGACKLHETILN